MTENGQQTKYHVLHLDRQNIDDSQTPSQPASVWATLGMLANRIKAITGRSTWQDSPPTNLTESKFHHDNRSNPHVVTRAQLGAAAQADLDSHTAARDNPHGVTAAQAGAPPNARTISTSAPLSGGGSLAANRTLSITEATTSAAGSMSAADKTKLDGLDAANYAPADHVNSRNGHPVVTTTQIGFMAAADKTKLNAIGQYLQLERVADQTLPATGWHILSFDSEVFDEMGWFAPASPTIIKPTVGCLVDVYLAASFEFNATGSRLMRLWSITRGISVFDTVPAYGSVDMFGRVGLAGPVFVQANEELRVEVYHNAGTSIYAGSGGSAGRPAPQIRMVRFT